MKTTSTAEAMPQKAKLMSAFLRQACRSSAMTRHIREMAMTTVRISTEHADGGATGQTCRSSMNGCSLRRRIEVMSEESRRLLSRSSSTAASDQCARAGSRQTKKPHSDLRISTKSFRVRFTARRYPSWYSLEATFENSSFPTLAFSRMTNRTLATTRSPFRRGRRFHRSI